jgi:hypothetical protein
VGVDPDMRSEVMESTPTRSDDEPAPSEAEVEKALKSLKNGKAAGCDGINAEMLKAGGGVLVKWIHRLISKIWQDEMVPDDWRKAVVVPLFKKGECVRQLAWDQPSKCRREGFHPHSP